MTYELKDWLNSINQNKKNIMNDDPSSEKDYAPYIINRCLSGHIDCVMYANEMNKYNFLPKRLQYDFFINIIRKKKRFSPWLNKEKIKDIDYVKRYYGYNNEKALQALSILSKEQLTFIKAKFETGGTK
jgi:hypothetical protein